MTISPGYVRRIVVGGKVISCVIAKFERISFLGMRELAQQQQDLTHIGTSSSQIP